MLTYLAREGASESQTQFALLTYCIENGIAFGRTKVGKATSLFWFGQMDPKKSPDEHALKDATPIADWVESIPFNMDQMITDSMPTRLQSKVPKAECESDSSKLFLHALRSVVKFQRSRDAEFERRLRIIEFARMNEPALAEGLLRMAVVGIYNFAVGEMMLELSDDSVVNRMAG
jgi:hypothetical protein